ncbi:MAG: S-layer homology domain-containing protein [Vallitalea sp.]|jgi:hypothetical protein|nr:S-layer homology domain-containing protein [Vallitalea sp.]
MKKTLVKMIVMMFTFGLLSIYAYADAGDMGYFGGISEGTNLPKTIEKYVPVKEQKTKTMQYKEIVFISGEPVTFQGTIKVTKNDDILKTQQNGTYTEKYDIKASNVDKNATLDRSIQFKTSFDHKDREYRKQIVTDSEVIDWKDKIEIDGVTYNLDEDISTFSFSGVKDITPGVSYYSNTISYNAHYITSDNRNLQIVTNGSIVGYDQPWSKVETGQITMDIQDKDSQMQILLYPSLEAKKTMYYDKTSPFPISFDGTYNQRLEREASLKYRVTTNHPNLSNSQLNNSILLTTANQIEKLPIPAGLDFMLGHDAEEDIKKLYSMEIFTEIPHRNMMVEAMPRGEFIKSLCIAMNIDTSDYIVTNRNKDNMKVVFGDVLPDNPLYPYIMAAYDAKLIKGTGKTFNISKPILRQEAFVIYIRVIGLQSIGVSESPATHFTDDKEIASWARKEIQAGYKLGIIKADKQGKISPTKWLSKVEAAATINHLIDYLREEISTYYRQ